jgi:GT2 family glycosyltransferase
VVDIIVRAKNGHAMTANCLASIRRNTPPGIYRIILSDDGSDPALSDALTDVYIRSRDSHGAVTATNLGLGVSLNLFDSEYTLILDNDVLIPDGDRAWLARMVEELEDGGPETACVGATSGYSNVPQHILSVPQTYQAAWGDENRAGMKGNPPVKWFISYCVLFRKTVLAQLGAWDERYNPGNWEDTDYAVRVRLAGYQIRVARSVYVHHLGSKTFSEALQKLLIENGDKFRAKWSVGTLLDLGMVTPQELKDAAEAA